jgi:hypothetical protein
MDQDPHDEEDTEDDIKLADNPKPEPIMTSKGKGNASVSKKK